MRIRKKPSSYSISERTLAMIELLSKNCDVSKTAVVEMAIRELWKKEMGSDYSILTSDKKEEYNA